MRNGEPDEHRDDIVGRIVDGVRAFRDEDDEGLAIEGLEQAMRAVVELKNFDEAREAKNGHVYLT